MLESRLNPIRGDVNRHTTEPWGHAPAKPQVGPSRPKKMLSDKAKAMGQRTSYHARDRPLEPGPARDPSFAIAPTLTPPATRRTPKASRRVRNLAPEALPLPTDLQHLIGPRDEFVIDPDDLGPDSLCLQILTNCLPAPIKRLTKVMQRINPQLRLKAQQFGDPTSVKVQGELI
jgi:hypothetical protein